MGMEGIPNQFEDKEKERDALVEELENLRGELRQKESAMHTEIARPTGLDTVPMQLEVDQLRQQVEAKELELARFDGRESAAPKPIEE